MNPKPTAREEYLEARVEALVRALEEAKRDSERVCTKYVWINSDLSEKRLGRLWDCERGNIVMEGPDGGFVYGPPEIGRLIIAALNGHTATEHKSK